MEFGGWDWEGARDPSLVNVDVGPCGPQPRSSIEREPLLPDCQERGDDELIIVTRIRSWRSEQFIAQWKRRSSRPKRYEGYCPDYNSWQAMATKPASNACNYHAGDPTGPFLVINKSPPARV